MNYYLYLYTNQENNRGYIGVTVNLNRRRKQHSKGNSGAKTFNRAMEKYGSSSFIFRILAILDNKDEAARVEQAAIAAYGTLAPNGYNLNGGAPYTLYNGPFSVQTRRKISSSSKGKIISPEARQKISVAFKGKPWTKARRNAYRFTEKQQETLEKRNSDPEFQRRRAEMNSSPEHRKQLEELAISNTGLKRSLETREKMSLAEKGRKLPQRSPEHCQKISENKKRWWNERKKQR